VRALALLIAGALLLVVPAPALAKKHKKKSGLGPVVTATVTGPVVTSPADSSTATASCPSGLQAVGGGFSAPFTSSVAMVVTESYRSSPGSWSVSGTLVAGSGAATAYAYCRRNTLRVTDVAASGTLASGGGQSQFVEAHCAPGAAAISGGFQMTSGPAPAHLPIPEVSLGGPAPAGTPPIGSWEVVAQNSNTGTQAITAHVYCASRIKVPAFRQDQGFATVPVFGSLTESSTCPVPPKRKKGTKKRKTPARLLSAGGFYSPFAPGTAVLPVHTDSRIAGNDFIDTAVNGGAGTGTLTAQSQAICF
jgi:hypothetical protein